MVPVQVVIFDMDGVLTDSEPLICEAAIKMLAEHGVEARPDDFKPFIGTGEDRYIGGVAEQYGLKLDLAKAKARTYEIYLEMVPKLQAYPGATDFVCLCREAGLRTAVASSADMIKVEANLERIRLPVFSFDAVVTAESVKEKKPAPDIFLEAARRIGRPGSLCTVIEDSPSGIQAAKAAGMRAIGLAHTHAAEELEAAGADLVRPGFPELDLQELHEEQDRSVAT